jgi:hypothetical protein
MLGILTPFACAVVFVLMIRCAHAKRARSRTEATVPLRAHRG